MRRRRRAASPDRRAIEQSEAEDAAADAGTAAANSRSVRGSYFSEIGRADLESCGAAGEFQIDSLCQAALLRYADYLAAAGGDASDEAVAELWRRHELTAKAYLQALEDFRS